VKQREPEREEVIEPEEEPGTVLIPGSLPSERVAEPATEPERTGSPG
jgi:hypothetical protein